MSHSPYVILARFIAQQAVRNGLLEDFHAGTYPSSATGDYSDVEVVTPYGRISWKKVSRLSDPEMRALMLQIETSIAKCLESLDALGEADYQMFFQTLEQSCFGPAGISWDRPEKAP